MCVRTFFSDGLVSGLSFCLTPIHRLLILDPVLYCIFLVRLYCPCTSCNYVLRVIVTKMSSGSVVGGPVDPDPQRLCPECHTNTMRRGEKHAMCFDCLDHGPLDQGDLRCLICRSWRPETFLKATAKYVEGSRSRVAAVTLVARENPDPPVSLPSLPPTPRGDVQEPPSTGTQDVPSAPHPPEESESGTGMPPPPLPPGGSGFPPPPPPSGSGFGADMLKDAILDVLKGIGFVPPPLHSLWKRGGRGRRLLLLLLLFLRKRRRRRTSRLPRPLPLNLLLRTG